MKKITTTLCISAILLSGSAFAQSGKRICGYIAPLMGDALQEGRPAIAVIAKYDKKNKTVDKKVCGKINDKIWDGIKDNTEINGLAWKKIERESCEDGAGKYVIDGTTYTSPDICDHMSELDGYVWALVPKDKTNPRAGLMTTKEKM